jgi:RNA polymerase sigma-70 factor (ECF subfamily)
MEAEPITMSARPAPDECALIAAGLRRRDPEVIEELVRQHRARVLRYLLAVTRSRDEAEDLSQETWVRVLERGSQYRGDWAFETWLLAVARNLAIDAARRESHWRAETAAEIGSRIAVGTSHQASPYDLARRQEVACRVRNAVRRLPAHLRAVWQLRFEDSLPLGAIAARLGMAPGTVRSRLHRSTAAIRALISRSGRN